MFLDEDPSEAVQVALMEIPAEPVPGGAIEEMKAAGGTPAELWLSASSKPLPPELVEAHVHERAAQPRAFALPEHLLEAPDDVEFRAFTYDGPWGGYAGYCDTFFASDWDSWAGAPADASASGTVAPASVDLFVYDKTDVWMGVCNNEPWDSDNTTISAMALYRDLTGAPLWSQIVCSGVYSANWCKVISKQNAKALHFWSSTTYDLKVSARWGGGVSHDVKLRVRSE